MEQTPRVKPEGGLVLPDDEERIYHYHGLPTEEHTAHALRPAQGHRGCDRCRLGWGGLAG